ncbi:MAG TPA: hypothetical protein VFB45_23745 [Pseudolabrys sp.]|nr:hypothetical protein [Pseudolabrys sp.]
MRGFGRVVAVTSLALEARIARGAGVSVLCEHAAQLEAALADAIAHGATGIISFGIAGGLASELAAGDWVVASRVRMGDEMLPTDCVWSRNLLAALPGAIHAEIVGSDILLPTPAEKKALHTRTGAAVVDMESHIAARVAARHSIPFAACRVVIDSAHRSLPPLADIALRPDGTPDIPAVCRSVLRDPTQLPDLLRAGIDAWIARRALQVGRNRLGAGLGFPALRVGHPEFARPQHAESVARVTA